MDEGYWEGLLKMEKNKTLKPDEDLKAIALALGHANEHGMAAEVMWSALTMAAEANEHGQTMEQVLEAALGEWDL